MEAGTGSVAKAYSSRRGDRLIRPLPLAIYYGWPSAVNGSNGTLSEALQVFRPFSVVALGGDTVERQGDPLARTLVPALQAGGVRTFGYASIGMEAGEPAHTLDVLRYLTGRWKSFGVSGILLDCVGVDYGVTRARFDAAVGLAHSCGLSVIANAWDPDDVLRGRSTLGPSDGYLGENDVMQDGELQDPSVYDAKLLKMTQYRASLGVELFATVTYNVDGGIPLGSERMLSVLRRYRLDYVQCTDPLYGAANNRIVRPWW